MGAFSDRIISGFVVTSWNGYFHKGALLVASANIVTFDLELGE